ncbi:hypothetical protein N8I77_011022 [Diaporthe amygdali]|uniref:Aquaporin-like protein n=1 Tax=Phomopsis amygdali TaxID=1214568 RepID=A0AAD9S4P5_PHOAM|nr:hypothetical protein N8I77_011022 [Diaporthe amygdali]
MSEEGTQLNHSEQHRRSGTSSGPFGEQGDYFQQPKHDGASSTRRTEQSSGSSSDKIKTRPKMASHPSTSASYTLGRMHEDPKTSDKISRVVAQLDDEGVENLEQLVSEFAKQRSKPKGQLTSSDYREQNPWYDQERSKPNFSLGDTLPHVGEDNEERSPGRDQDTDKPVFSLGEPLPHTVRRSRQPRNDDEDVEQGIRRIPTKERVDSDETLQETRQRTTNRPQNDQDEGTETAKKFQIDADTVGGQREQDAVEDGKADPNSMRNWWARFRAKYPELMAEFLCTAMSVFLGVAGTLTVNLSQNQPTQYGSYETLCWAWGLAFMFGIYMGGGVSGAHMNPAISISLTVYRGFPWKRCIAYVVVQVLGAFAGGIIAYGLYHDAIMEADPTMTETYSSWFAVPQQWVSPATAFFSEFIGGAVIMIAVLSLGDDQNNPPGAGMHAFVLGLLVAVLKMTLGYNTGGAMNPAADLGPRLAALAGGYRTDDLFKTGFWAYGPWGASVSGALVGSAVYDAVVFVGSESPINYRWSKEQHKWRALTRK